MRDRVARPRPPGGHVGEAAPEIDDEATVDMDRDRRAQLAALLEAAGERVANGLEPRIAVALHAHRATMDAATRWNYRRRGPRGMT